MYVYFLTTANRAKLTAIIDIRNAIDCVLDGINANSGVCASASPHLHPLDDDDIELRYLVDISGGAKGVDAIKEELVSLMESAGFTESEIKKSYIILNKDLSLRDKNLKAICTGNLNIEPKDAFKVWDERLLSPKALELNHYHRYHSPVAIVNYTYLACDHSVINDIEFVTNTTLSDEELLEEAVHDSKEKIMLNIDPFDMPNISMVIQTRSAITKMKDRIRQSKTLPAPLLLVSDTDNLDLHSSDGIVLSYIMRSLAREGWLCFSAVARLSITFRSSLSKIEATLDYMRGGVVELVFEHDINDPEYAAKLGRLLKSYSSKVCIVFRFSRYKIDSARELLVKKLGFKCTMDDVIEINSCMLFNPLKVTNDIEDACRSSVKEYLRGFGGNDALIDSFIFSLNKRAYYKDELSCEYQRYITLYSAEVSYSSDENDEYLRKVRNFSFYDGDDDYDPGIDYTAELAKLIGLENAKKCLSNIIKESKMRKKRGTADRLTRKHMAFLGNPGTGKTTVAKLFAYALRQNGCLDEKNPCAFYAVGSASLVGKYQGHTTAAVNEVFNNGQGSVIFIDEAYDLAEQSDFGRQAINEIVRQMEISDPHTIVIFGGYTDETRDMLKLNRGLESRVRHYVMFDDYTVDQLIDIAQRRFKAEKLEICEEGVAIMKDGVQKIYDELGAMAGKELGNARFIENVVNDIVTEQCVRVCDADENDIRVTAEDVRRVLSKYLDEYICKAAKGRVGF